MNASKVVLAAALGVVGLVAMAPAEAHGYRGGARGHWYGPSVGLYIGGPAWWGAGGYYGAPYAYVPPPTYVVGPPAVVTSTAGVVYIESNAGVTSTQSAPPANGPAAAAAAPDPAPPPGGQWWYLCASPRGAYPYVRECPGGWERVPAVPPGAIR